MGGKGMRVRLPHTCTICKQEFLGGPGAKYCYECKDQLNKTRNNTYKRLRYAKEKKA